MFVIAISSASSSCSWFTNPCALPGTACADGLPLRTAATRYLHGRVGYNILHGEPRGNQTRQNAINPKRSKLVILNKIYIPCTHVIICLTMAKSNTLSRLRAPCPNQAILGSSASAEGSYGLVDHAFTLSSSYQEKKNGFQQLAQADLLRNRALVYSRRSKV